MVHGIIGLLCAKISVFSAYGSSRPVKVNGVAFGEETATSLLHFQAGISGPRSSKF